MNWTNFLVRILAGGLMLVAGLLGAVSASAEVVFPPGQRIGLNPPPGLVLNRDTGRFADAETGAALSILELPAYLYGEMERAMFADTGAPGVTVEARQSFPFNDGIGFLVVAHVKTNDAEYKRWNLLATGTSNTGVNFLTVVSVEVPVKALDRYPDAAVRAALRSVTFRPPPIEERLSLLPFKFGDLAGFNVINVAPLGAVLADGPPSASGRAEITVSAAQGEVRNAEDRERLARQLFLSAGLRDIRVVNAEPLRITGAQGYEIRGTARTPANIEISVVLWVRFSGNAQLQILAAVPTADWDRLYPRFRALRDGIEFRR